MAAATGGKIRKRCGRMSGMTWMFLGLLIFFIVAAGFTARCNDTTVATTNGTSTVMEELAWNERNTPWERWIPEEMRPVAIQGEVIIIRAETTIADDLTIGMTFFVEEGF